MSAYVVEDVTINKIVGYFKIGRNCEHARYWIAKTTGLDITKQADAEAFGRQLLMLNIQAVNERYHETADGTDELTTYRFSYDHSVNSRITVYKAIQCYLYQCSEGDTPDMELYRLVESLKGWLADSIIRDMPDYDRAPWG